jgi:hypothetical protein
LCHFLVTVILSEKGVSTYNLRKVDSGLVHETLGNLGHDHIESQDDGNDDTDDGGRDAANPELATTIEFGAASLFDVFILVKLVVLLFIFFTDIEGHDEGLE